MDWGDSQYADMVVVVDDEVGVVMVGLNFVWFCWFGKSCEGCEGCWLVCSFFSL